MTHHDMLKRMYYAQLEDGGVPTGGLVFYSPLNAKTDAETGQAISYLDVTYEDSYKGIGCISQAAYGTNNAITFNSSAFTGDTTYSIWFCPRDTDAREFSLLTLGTVSIATCSRPELRLRGTRVAAGIVRDSWHSMQLTYSEGTFTAYLDGTLAGIVAYTPAETTAVLKNMSSTKYIHSWANCRIYNRLLRPKEIQALAMELRPTA